MNHCKIEMESGNVIYWALCSRHQQRLVLSGANLLHMTGNDDELECKMCTNTNIELDSTLEAVNNSRIRSGWKPVVYRDLL